MKNKSRDITLLVYALASIAYSVYAPSLSLHCHMSMRLCVQQFSAFLCPWTCKPRVPWTRAFIQETGFAPWVGVGRGFKVNKGRVVVCSLVWRNNLFLPYWGRVSVPMTLNSPTPPLLQYLVSLTIKHALPIIIIRYALFCQDGCNNSSNLDCYALNFINIPPWFVWTRRYYRK